MAVTATIINGRAESFGSRRVVIADLAFDSSYPTGGESVLPGLLGMQTIDFLLAEPAGGYSFEYHHTNQKLLARQGDNTNAAAAPSVEVPDTTDLSAVTGVRVIAIGTV